MRNNGRKCAQVLQDKSIDNIVNEFADNLRVGADIIR